MVRVHELFFSIPEQYSEKLSLLSLFIMSGASVFTIQCKCSSKFKQRKIVTDIVYRLIHLRVVSDNDHRHDLEFPFLFWSRALARQFPGGLGGDLDWWRAFGSFAV